MPSRAVNGQRRLLLLLDADTTLHPFIQAALRRAPHAPLRHLECHAVVHPDELRNHLRQRRYHVALLSLESAGHPTWPLLENAHRALQLVQEAPHTHRPSLVAMTSVGTTAHREAILRLGFAGYLCKPFTLATLYHEMATALRLTL